ncbi:MAG: hypothetical protein M3Q68_01365, partial [Actinomycetota bacterium]|nr:hypothetical protein [Actinomycetota bacterium]
MVSWRRLIRALVVVAVPAVAAATGAGSAVAAEGDFRFTQPQAQIPEAQAMVRIVVERLDLPVSRAVVGYRTEGRSAIAGEDFLDATGTLVFDVGVTTSSFTLFLRDDDRVEPPEQLIVHLSTNTSSTLTILDDDQAATPGPPARATVAAPPPTTAAPRVLTAPATEAPAP